MKSVYISNIIIILIKIICVFYIGMNHNHYNLGLDFPTYFESIYSIGSSFEMFFKSFVINCYLNVFFRFLKVTYDVYY